MKEKTNSMYLQKVTLMGYKSIKDVVIDLVPGLNIMIGKNAAGKTNFLSFLDKCLSLNFEEMYFFSSWLEFKKGEDTIVLSSGKAFPPHHSMDDLLASKPQSSIKINDGKTKVKNGIVEKSDLNKAGARYKNIFIRHGLPSYYPIVDAPLSFSMGKSIFPNELLEIIKTTDSNFVNDLCFSLISSSFQFDNNTDPNDDFIRKMLSGTFSKLSELKNILTNFSPIKDIRLNENFNIHIIDNTETFIVSNLSFEFNIDGYWLPFSNLSDGTKRIFYILSETFDYYRLINDDYNRNYDNIQKIILIEEPELGVHPHQFKKIMDFLKEQSKTKQIIISTHSPQALNVLDKNDLNRIIIAYSGADGTQLRHLEQQEINKARAYIDEVFLGDYWLYSDLEK